MPRPGAISDLHNLVNEARGNNSPNGSVRSPHQHSDASHASASHVGSRRSSNTDAPSLSGSRRQSNTDAPSFSGSRRQSNADAVSISSFSRSAAHGDTDAASISSFSRSVAHLARAAETKDAASVRSGASRSMASRSTFLPANLNPAPMDRGQSNGSGASVGSRRSRASDSDRTDTTARLMSLVQELSQGSRPSPHELEEERRKNDELEKEVQMLRDTLQPEIYINNNSNDDDVSAYVSVDESHYPPSSAPSGAPSAPPPSSARSKASSRSHGSSAPPYPVPYMQQGSQGVHGMRQSEDPSVASRSAASSNYANSYLSHQYSRGASSGASSGTGSEDPGGYVMPMGMGVLPDGTVFSQHTSSVYGGGSYQSQMSQESSILSGSQISGSVSQAQSVASGSIMSNGQSIMSGSQAMSNGQPSVRVGQSSSVRSGQSSMRSGQQSMGSAHSSVPSSSQSAPGGGIPMDYGDQSIMSKSYMSQPLMSEASASQGMQSMPNYGQVVPHFGGEDFSQIGDQTFGSRGSRSIAGSAALVPKAKFSWASESIGTQSTVMTRRSLNSASVPEPNEPRKSKVTEGRLWSSFAWIVTFPIPNKCINRPTKDAKQAWREKVALFLIMVSCSVFFVGAFGFVPLLLCKEDTIFAMQDIWLQTGENWLVIHGVVYDVKDLIYRHPGGVDGIVDFLGKDASKIFPRSPPSTLPQKCLDMEKVEAYKLNVKTEYNNFTNPTCASFSDLDVLLGITCHTFAAGSNGTAKFLGDYARGVLSHTTSGLNSDGIRWIAIYDRVYDVTTYVNGINQNQEPALDGEEPSLKTNPGAYLTPTLNKVIMNSLNSDATDLYEALFGSTEYIACLEEIFYVGLLDDTLDTFCYSLNIMMYVMLIFVASLMVIQFLASMVYICPRHRTYSEEDVMSPVMVMVPCYNEGDNELRKTIKSVLNTTYPDENKVLFMVGDGLVTGNGEDMSTPEHLANILGFDIDEFEDDTFEYDCIGVTHTKNRARVYHGILQKGHKFLKYIAVVKCGLPAEATTSAKPGNRGKRDSQLVTMGYFNRIHYGRELTELDSAVQRAMVDLNLQADMVRFLMAIDADTRVDEMSITHMVYGMDKKEKVLALCGETKVDNKASSWVTMIQVFEYYNSHHLKKAFEAAFGCVTCLPGCFTMYRIIADDGTPLLPADGVLYDYSRNDVETLHEKNLYHLGEDRMLTTLLLKHFPDRSLTFIPEAACWTIVPHTFKILLSQRRRWINSTVHNMFELLKVNTMCGVCCVSMKLVVFIDLLATMILPASYCYAMYLIFLVFFEDLPVSTILLILYGIIMGVQVVVFILRSRWEYIWWFFVYFTIGLPVFYLVLPTYSFWNMDDFSWGKTRAVGGSAAANAGDNDEDDEDGLEKLKDLDGEGSMESGYGEDDRSTTSSSSGSSSPSDEESEYSASDDVDGSDIGSRSDDGSDGDGGSDEESEYSSDEESQSQSNRSRGKSFRSAPSRY